MGSLTGFHQYFVLRWDLLKESFYAPPLVMSHGKCKVSIYLFSPFECFLVLLIKKHFSSLLIPPICSWLLTVSHTLCELQPAGTSRNTNPYKDSVTKKQIILFFDKDIFWFLASKGGRGGLAPHFLADMICEHPLRRIPPSHRKLSQSKNGSCQYNLGIYSLIMIMTKHKSIFKI